MWDLFKAELLRFRGWALAFAALHLVVLGFFARIMDLAQQDDRVYQAIAFVFVLAGLLLGLYQLGTYRRPNAWLNLLHRPLSHRRIALALLGAGAVLLAVGVLLPLAIIAGWQETTTRVLDDRHLALCLSGWLLALCGYLTGAYAMLAGRRWGVAAFVFLVWIVFGHAQGVGAIAVQGIALAWLLLMVLLAFKPDRSALTAGLPGGAAAATLATIATALPLQMAMWCALLLAGFGVEMVWVAQGSHPNNLAVDPPDSAKAANNAEPRELMALGLRGSRDVDAAVWREQAAISEVYETGTGFPFLPVRHELTNAGPLEFDDEKRGIHRIFSHDSLRFEGFRLADQRAVAALGVDAANAPFPAVPLVVGDGWLLTRGMAYQWDEEAGRVLPRIRVPRGEILGGIERMGDRLAVLTDRALYLYDARALTQDDGVLVDPLRMPMPGRVGNLTRVAVMELVDGYLATFLFTHAQHNAEGDAAYQATLRVGTDGKVSLVAKRLIPVAYPPLWRYQNVIVSPALYALRVEALDAFSGYTPVLDDRAFAPVPRSVVIASGVLALLSLLLAAWRTRRLALPTSARLAWIAACGALGVPAVMALWLLYEAEEGIEDVRVAQPAMA